MSRLKINLVFDYAIRSFHAKIGDFHSRSDSGPSLIFVNYNIASGTDLLKKELKYFKNKYCIAKTSAIYICASNSNEKQKKHDKLTSLNDMIEKHELCEVTLEILFEESNDLHHKHGKSIIDAISPNRICLKLLQSKDIFHLLENWDRLSSMRNSVSLRAGVSVDIKLPCSCTNVDVDKFLTELQKCTKHFMHIVLEQSICQQYKCQQITCDENFLTKYALSQNVFQNNGFFEYKFCHFAKSANYKSMYMTLLSHGNSYVGLGAESHSRFECIDQGKYVRVGYKNCPLSNCPVGYILPQLDCLAEILLLGLDTVDGVSAETWNKYSNECKLKDFGKLKMIQELRKEGLLNVSSNGITVPKEHWTVLNSIINEILSVMEEKFTLRK